VNTEEVLICSVGLFSERNNMSTDYHVVVLPTDTVTPYGTCDI